MLPERLWLLLALCLCAGLARKTRFQWVGCPQYCNYQGDCLRNNSCACYSGFTGADCSLRTCSYGPAWASKPYALNLAHSSQECSGRGLCNRKNGKCKCFSGYAGEACERVSCGVSNCNSRGTCLNTGNLFTLFSTNRSSAANYTSWDYASTTACVCDHGYTGANCETRLCPMGDDPLTTTTGYIKFNFTTSALFGYISGGAFLFTIMGESISFPADASSWNSTDCTTAFSNLRPIKSASCNRSQLNTYGGGTYSVEIITLPYLPRLNNIYPYSNAFPFASLKASCVEQYATAGSQYLQCDIYDLTSSDATLPEYSVCSNRGRCDTSTGECFCYPAFTGAACDNFKYNGTANNSTTNDAILYVKATDPDFNASVLSLYSITEGTESFNFLKISDNLGEIVSVDGEGTVRFHRGGLHLDGIDGQTIASGGLVVGNGITVQTSGLSVVGDSSITGKVYISGSNNNISGSVTVTSGGVRVNSGVSIVAGGMRLGSGAMIQSGGASFMGGGVSITGGMTVSAGGLYIQSYKQHYVQVQSSGLFVRGGVTATGSTAHLVVSGGVSVLSGGLASSGKFTVVGGMSSSALSVVHGGLLVNAGGATLASFAVTGGATLTGDISCGGVTVNSGGVYVGQGLDALSSDMTISSGGVVYGGLSGTSLAAISGGMSVTGDAVFTSSGALVRNGLMIGGSVTTASLAVASGVTTSGNTAVLSGGLTISSAGLRMRGRMTISQGLLVTGGATITSTGSTIESLTITTGGLLLNHGSVSISSGNMHFSNGISTTLSGVLVEGDMTVDSVGLYSNSGATLTGDISLSGTSTIYSGGAYVGSGTSSPNSGNFVVYQGVTVTGDTVIPFGSLTVENGDVRVTSGGATLGSLGLVTGEDVRVLSGGMYAVGMTIESVSSSSIIGGMSIDSSGITVANGLTVLNHGLTVSTGGLTVMGPGLVYGGLSIATGGSFITGGLSVIANGMSVGSAMTIGNGLIVTTGLTASSAAMFITGGLSIPSGSASISGNVYLTSPNAAVVVTGGVSVNQATALISSTGATVASGGLVTGGSMTVGSSLSVGGGLAVSGSGTIGSNGLSVGSGGVFVGNSMSVATSSAATSSLSSLSIGSGAATITGSSVISGSAIAVTGGFTVTTGGLAVSNGLVVDSYKSDAGISVASGGFRVVSYDGNGWLVGSGGLFANGGLTLYGHAVWYNYYTTSDERLKSEVRLIEKPLEKLSRLRGVYYSWRGGGTSQRLLGVIAQEVQEILPELVHVPLPVSVDGRTQYLRVKYQGLVPLLVEAVKTLDSGISEQKSNFSRRGDDSELCEALNLLIEEIDSLGNRISDLQTMIELRLSMIMQSS